MKKIILLLFTLVAFTAVRAQGVDADDETNVKGIINFEANGKKYVSSKISGNIMGDLNKVAIMNIYATANTNGREQIFMVYLKNNWAFKTGKTVLGKDDIIGNTAHFTENPLNVNPDDLNPPEPIAVSSDAGSFTITSASMIAKDKAHISGNFEFTGKNDNGKGVITNYAVKGNFSDLIIFCITKQVILGQ